MQGVRDFVMGRVMDCVRVRVRHRGMKFVAAADMNVVTDCVMVFDMHFDMGFVMDFVMVRDMDFEMVFVMDCVMAVDMAPQTGE